MGLQRRMIWTVGLMHVLTGGNKAVKAETGACRAEAVKCDSDGPRSACGAGNGLFGVKPDEATCISVGCCWSPPPVSPATVAAANLPSCFYSNAGASTYELKGSLSRKNGSARGVSSLAQGTLPMLGADIQNLAIETKRIATGVLEVKIGPVNDSRWEIPNRLFERTAYGGGNGDVNFALEVVTKPLGFAVSRKDTNESVFDTRSHRLIFKDQYIEISSTIPASTQLYGLGEQAPTTGLPLRRDGVPYTLWAHDTWAGYYDINNYGAHPFYMAVDENGKAHGVLLWNSNGMDVGITKDRLQYRVIGGLLDFFFLMGPTPADVMEQMTSIVGRPALPPYWAMGFMNSKYGYYSVEECQEVVDNYTKAGLPLEVFISDSQYMDKNKLFTLDPKGYPADKIKAFIDKLHKNGQRWVPILEPGVLVDPGYEPYDSGMKAGVFITDYTREVPVLGVLWPGGSYFPDFLAAKTEDWWGTLLQKFSKLAPFDGIWLDMTEPTSACSSDQCHVQKLTADRQFVTADNGEGPTQAEASLVARNAPLADSAVTTFAVNLTSFDETSPFDIKDLYAQLLGQVGSTLVKVLGRELLTKLVGQQFIDAVTCPFSCSNVNPDSNPKAYAKSNPPYTINSIDGDMKARVPLNYRTVPVSAYHLDDIAAYDAHNLYGHSMARATFRSLEKLLQKRPFVLARSTFVGSGAYTAHWTGDIKSDWQGLKNSIPDIMANSLAGIPFTGADICGFNDHATEELCCRWIAAGAFYPFARDHHADGYQELYRWDKVITAGKAALAQRYSLLNYMYTAFFYSSQMGSPIMKPLFFAAPGDPDARDTSYQWMFGDSIMATPLILPNVTSFEAYFPQGTWFHLKTHKRLVSKGQSETVHQGLEEPANAFVAGGHIVPLAEPAMVTNAVKASKVQLLVALSGGAHQPLRTASAGCIPGNDVACGQMYVDEGEQLEIGHSRDNHLTFTAIQGASGGKVWALFGGNPLDTKGECAKGNGAAPPVTISDVIILGAQSGTSFTITPTTVSSPAVNATALAAAGIESESKNATLSFDKDGQRLSISGLDFKLACPTGFELSWS